MCVVRICQYACEWMCCALCARVGVNVLVHVRVLVSLCSFHGQGSGIDSGRSAMASASRRPTSGGETGATRPTPAPSVRRYG